MCLFRCFYPGFGHCGHLLLLVTLSEPVGLGWAKSTRSLPRPCEINIWWDHRFLFWLSMWEWTSTLMIIPSLSWNHSEWSHYLENLNCVSIRSDNSRVDIREVNWSFGCEMVVLHTAQNFPCVASFRRVLGVGVEIQTKDFEEYQFIEGLG